MDQEERVAIDAVIDRIADRFPGIERERIASLVNAEAQELSDAPVQDFVPVLVEHQVMDALREEADPVPIDELALGDRLSPDAEPDKD